MTKSEKIKILESGLINQRTQLNLFIDSDSSIAEIGVKEGDFFRFLIQNNPRLVYAIDCWDLFNKPSQDDANEGHEKFKQIYDEFVLNFSQPNVKIIKDFSPQCAINVEDNSLDFIYIDGDHTYDAVSQDISAWWSKAKVGAIFAGHDYAECSIEENAIEFGVIRAVDEFVLNNNLKLYIIPDGRWKTWIIVK